MVKPYGHCSSISENVSLAILVRIYADSVAYFESRKVTVIHYKVNGTLCYMLTDSVVPDQTSVALADL